ncbi:15742_t:CDS:2 [Funneliformis geosporum]|nr:15742_t:CDS:2 [Funneliformis geosporum]
MKVQLIMLFLIACLATESYAKQCLVYCKGKFTHTLGGDSGCYGTEPADPFNECDVSVPGTKYEFFDSYGCKDSVIVAGKDHKTFHPSVKAHSVKITCP